MRAKHFQQLTEALRQHKPKDGEPLVQWSTDVETVAKVYDKLFPRFSRHKFLVACGVPVPPTRKQGVRTRVLKELRAEQEALARKVEELSKALADERAQGNHHSTLAGAPAAH